MGSNVIARKLGSRRQSGRMSRGMHVCPEMTRCNDWGFRYTACRRIIVIRDLTIKLLPFFGLVEAQMSLLRDICAFFYGKTAAIPQAQILHRPHWFAPVRNCRDLVARFCRARVAHPAIATSRGSPRWRDRVD